MLGNRRLTTLLLSSRSFSTTKTTTFTNFRAHELSTITTKAQLLTSYSITPPIKHWPINLTEARFLHLLRRNQNLDLQVQIFQHAAHYQPNFTHTYQTYYAIILRLARAREFPTLESILAQLKSTNIKLEEQLFVTVIRYYGISYNPNMAFRTFLRINKEFGVETTHRSFHTLLNALVLNKEFDLVKMLVRNCKRKFGIVANVFTFNLLIRALCKKGDLDGAVRVMEEMERMGMVLNPVSFVTVLDGYVEKGDMGEAKKVFDEILGRGWLPDATTYNIFMDGLVKEGRLGDAVNVMDEMKKIGAKPNDLTYGLMIETFCKEKKSGEAIDLLHEMLKKRHVPSSSVCCKLISLLCEEGKVGYCCELWELLLIKECLPDDTVLSTLIHWLCKEGKVQEARRLFNEFDRGPSLLTYNTLIAGMCENGELCEAGRLFDDMVEKGCKPIVFTYNVLIKGICKGGNVKGGIKLLEDMLDNRCLPNKLTFAMLTEVLCESGCEADISGVLYLVGTKGHGIGSVCWSVFVTKFISDIENPGVVLDKVLSENVV